MRVVIAIVLSFALPSVVGASQPLETETARPLPAGMFKLELTPEFQNSKDGTERAIPFLIEYGFTNRTELTVEPVFGSSIRPKGGPRASGAGDLEVTLTHLFLDEGPTRPAFALAGEVKFPTARNRQIGTGKTDYTVWTIASKRLERLDVHGNLGYTVVGRPAGTHLKNIVDYALAEEFHMSPRLDFVGEFVGNTSSTGERVEGQPTSGNIPPEATGAENSVLLGVRYYVRPSLFFAIGLSYDSNHALLVRPGITYRFKTQ